MKTVLVLGGTGFIGRHFVERMSARSGVQITLANRGTAPGLFMDLERLTIDRDNFASCQTAFQGRSWDCVFDFSGTDYRRVLNCVTTLETGHYTYLSSSAVDLALPDDPYLEMAKEKLWCEHIVSKGFDSLTVRAAFVVGKYDNTGRFECRQGDWFWKGTENIVCPVIEAEMLVQSMEVLGMAAHCGVLRAGYSETAAV